MGCGITRRAPLWRSLLRHQWRAPSHELPSRSATIFSASWCAPACWGSPRRRCCGVDTSSYAPLPRQGQRTRMWQKHRHPERSRPIRRCLQRHWRSSRGTFLADAARRKVPPLRLAALGYGRDDGTICHMRVRCPGGGEQGAHERCAPGQGGANGVDAARGFAARQTPDTTKPPVGGFVPTAVDPLRAASSQVRNDPVGGDCKGRRCRFG